MKLHPHDLQRPHGDGLHPCVDGRAPVQDPRREPGQDPEQGIEEDPDEERGEEVRQKGDDQGGGPVDRPLQHQVPLTLQNEPPGGRDLLADPVQPYGDGVTGGGLGLGLGKRLQPQRGHDSVGS
jgi:hypothetical protein